MHNRNVWAIIFQISRVTFFDASYSNMTAREALWITEFSNKYFKRANTFFKLRFHHFLVKRALLMLLCTRANFAYRLFKITLMWTWSIQRFGIDKTKVKSKNLQIEKKTRQKTKFSKRVVKNLLAIIIINKINESKA